MANEKKTKYTIDLTANYDDVAILRGEESPETGVLVSPARHEFYVTSTQKFGICKEHLDHCVENSSPNFWMGVGVGGIVATAIFAALSAFRK